jgi:hypothetical protein
MLRGEKMKNINKFKKREIRCGARQFYVLEIRKRQCDK